MSFPRLKNALLCRILVYVVVIGAFIVPLILVANLSFIPDTIKIVVCLGLAIGLPVYIILNIGFLMATDTLLAMQHCINTARKWFTLPKSFSVQKLEKRIFRFGKGYEPIAYSPRPQALRYKSQAAMTIYSRGIEKVIAAYSVDSLSKSQYHLIFNSAIANSKALNGKKKHLILDKTQKKSPLNRVTVIMIFAKQIDEALRPDLFNVVQKNAGDGYDTAVLPCVIDLEKQICTFDSERIPYEGFQYPVKNRGIKIIRRCVFHGKLPFADSPDQVEPIKDLDLEQSLWSFLRMVRKELVLEDRELRRRFEKMKHREIVVEDGELYLKWQDRGIWISVEWNDELRIAEIDAIKSWVYPNSNLIAKDTIKEMQNLINAYCAGLGYTAKYASYECVPENRRG